MWDGYNWEHPSHAKFEKDVAAGRRDPGWTSEVTLVEGGRLNGWETIKPLPPLTDAQLSKICSNPKTEKYYQDWLAGKFVIPGLKVEIRTPDGKVYGPCKVKRGAEPTEREARRGKRQEIRITPCSTVRMG